MKKFVFFILSILFLDSCAVEGCTDPYSKDYNVEATKDDGTCTDERAVIFSLEIDENYSYSYPDTQSSSEQGSSDGYISFEYTSAGLNQNGFSGVVVVGQQTGLDIVLYNEANEIILTKNDNITIRFLGSSIRMENISYTAKAQIEDEEIILFSKTLNNTTDPGITWNESKNWILP